MAPVFPEGKPGNAAPTACGQLSDGQINRRLIVAALRSISGLPLAAALALLLLVGAPGLCSAFQVSNLDRIRQCARLLSDSLLQKLDREDICVRVVEHPASWVLDQAMVEAASARSVTVLPCQAPFDNESLMAITSVGVQYVELDGSVGRRDVRFGFSASVPVPIADRTGRQTRSYEIVLSDTIDLDGTSSLEDSAYPFTIGTSIHKRRSGFWKKIVEPAVVIGTSVVMVVLLFTVRSQ